MTDDSPSPRAYHHGNLVEVLVAAAVALVEEQGLAAVSVREVARRAGVSPAAPFRHFASKAALMTAVAEQAMGRLSDSMARALADAPQGAGPMARLRAMGQAYMAWVVANPTHFLIVSSRSDIDFAGSRLLVEQNEALRRSLFNLLGAAQAQGQLRPGLVVEDLVLSLRALSYGAARLWADGHFPQWQVSGPPVAALTGMVEVFLTSIEAAPPAPPGP